MRILAGLTIVITALSFGLYFLEDSNGKSQVNHVKETNLSENLLATEKNNIKIYEAVSPTVVHVSNIKSIRGFFDLSHEDIPRGAGSGFIWDSAGHVVTNYHVVAGGDSFAVGLQKQKDQFPAELVGAEPNKDIAVLRLKKMPKKLRSIEVGNSANVRVGQKALAIGNPFGLDHSLSVGTVSALGRKMKGVTGVEIRDMIQTDAAINPGNSGGPLVNSQGALIGMNTAIVSRSGSSAGIGFAVPVDTIKRIVPQLIEHGEVIRPGLGFYPLDERMRRYFEIEKGIIIRSVGPGSAADKAGLEGIKRGRNGNYFVGDVILKVDDKEVNNFNDIYHVLDQYKVGQKVEITYLEGGEKKRTKTIRLQKLDVN